MDKQVITVKWESDESHAWLAVRANDMAALGLRERDMSPYSYKDIESAAPSLYYLEEYCDAGYFFEAAEKLGYEIKQTVRNNIGYCSIRNKPRIKGESLIYKKKLAEYNRRAAMREAEDMQADQEAAMA